MSLHRAVEPDWKSIPPQDLTSLQILAAKSRGIVTIGNLVTLIGLGLVVMGFVFILNDTLFLGVLLIAIGRFADLLDGYLADVTKTKSPVGEAFDAGMDKLELAIAVPILLVTPYANRLLVIFLLLHLVINVVLFFIAHQKHQRIHPTRAGKLSTATAWIAAGLFVLANVNMASWLQNLTSIAAILCSIVFVTLAIVSGIQYYHQLEAHVEI